MTCADFRAAVAQMEQDPKGEATVSTLLALYRHGLGCSDCRHFTEEVRARMRAAGHKPLPPEEIAAIETLVNQQLRDDPELRGTHDPLT